MNNRTCVKCGKPLGVCGWSAKYCVECRELVRGERKKFRAAAKRRKRNKKPPTTWTGCVICGKPLVVENGLYCAGCTAWLKVPPEEQIASLGGTDILESGQGSTVTSVVAQAKERGISYGQMRVILDAQKQKQKEKEKTLAFIRLVKLMRQLLQNRKSLLGL